MTLFLLYYTTVFVFAAAAAIGSFLNVVIYRVPAGLSVVKPASRCPECKSEIRWFDNIPIISWFILRGACRRCGCRISPRYAFVEFLTGVVGAFIWYQRFAPIAESGAAVDASTLLWVALPSAFYFVFACLLITISFVDLDHFLIPHEFTIPGMVMGLSAPWVFHYALGEGYIMYLWPPVGPWTSLAGFISGGLIIVIVFYAYLAARGVEGMGGGDVTLMAMVGAWLGWPALIFILFASSIQGLLAAGLSVFFDVDFVKDAAEVFADDSESSEEAVLEDDQEAQDVPSLEDDVLQVIHSSREGVESGEFTCANPTVEVDETRSLEHSQEPPDVESTIPAGKLAIPFGPFISLSALEYLLFGLYLPHEISLIDFYY